MKKLILSVLVMLPVIASAKDHVAPAPENPLHKAGQAILDFLLGLVS